MLPLPSLKLFLFCYGQKYSQSGMTYQIKTPEYIYGCFYKYWRLGQNETQVPSGLLALFSAIHAQ